MIGVISAIVVSAGAGISLVKTVNGLCLSTERWFDKLIKWDTIHCISGEYFVITSTAEFVVMDEGLSILEEKAALLSSNKETERLMRRLLTLGVLAWARGLPIEAGLSEVGESLRGQIADEFYKNCSPQEQHALLGLGILMVHNRRPPPQEKGQEQGTLGTSESAP